VNVIQNEDGTYDSDAYFPEIKEALDQKRSVYCKLGGGVYHLDSISSRFAVFVSHGAGYYSQLRIGDDASTIILTSSTFIPKPSSAKNGQILQYVVPTHGTAGWVAADLPIVEPYVPFNPWGIKRVGIIGDSQTEINGHKTSLWIDEVRSVFASGTMKAKSGYTIANNPESYGNFMTLAQSLSRAVDVVLVMGGVNDVWFNTPMGELGSTDNTTFYGAMEELCQFFMNNYPAKQIAFITPTEQNNANCNGSNTTGLTATDFAHAIKKVCAKYAIPVYDANSMCGIYPLNAVNAAVYTTDNLHLNDSGQKRLGQQVLAFVQNHCYVPEEGEALTDLVGTALHAHYSNNSLYVNYGTGYGGVMLPGVTDITVDLSAYTFPMVNCHGKNPAWFAFKQADGSYQCVAIAKGEGLTGEAWDFDATCSNPTNQRVDLWAAPDSMPQRVSVVLKDQRATIYLDETEVYSAPCVELGYIGSKYFGEMTGVTLTYEQ
jgi:lysophospholipase L1-like esterase